MNTSEFLVYVEKAARRLQVGNVSIVERRDLGDLGGWLTVAFGELHVTFTRDRGVFSIDISLSSSPKTPHPLWGVLVACGGRPYELSKRTWLSTDEDLAALCNQFLYNFDVISAAFSADRRADTMERLAALRQQVWRSD